MTTTQSEENGTQRLEAFSDGVFAIAITLLVLEIAVPHLKPGEKLGSALWDEWPSYIGYVLSFVTIGIMWINHHVLIKDIRHVDRMAMMLNVLLLMFVSFVPFPTAVLAEYLNQGAHRLPATIFYGGTFTAIALVWNALWLYASRGRRLIEDRVPDERIKARTKLYLASPIIYGIGVPLAFVTPWLSLAFYTLLDLAYMLPLRE